MINKKNHEQNIQLIRETTIFTEEDKETTYKKSTYYLKYHHKFKKIIFKDINITSLTKHIIKKLIKMKNLPRESDAMQAL